MRLTEFLSAFLLKKHQRALVTNFQKNTLSDLGWSRWIDKNGVKKQMSSLSDSVVSAVRTNSITKNIQAEEENILDEDEDPLELD